METNDQYNELYLSISFYKIKINKNIIPDTHYTAINNLNITLYWPLVFSHLKLCIGLVYIRRCEAEL